jgi:hypothetical protein
MSHDQLQLVILDCPVDAWEEPGADQAFHRMVRLKLRGYASGEYPYGVIPVDATDFVGTHILFCRRDADGLTPLMGYKSITYGRCRTFGMKFPPLAIAEGAGSFAHQRDIRARMERWDAEPDALRYCSSYTIEPSMRRDRAFISGLKELLGGMQVHFLRDMGTRDSMLCGVVKFKVDKMFVSWGYKGLAEGGRELPTMHQASLQGTEVKMLSLPDGFLDVVHGWAERVRPLWENRITLARPPAAAATKKAA